MGRDSCHIDKGNIVHFTCAKLHVEVWDIRKTPFKWSFRTALALNPRISSVQRLGEAASFLSYLISSLSGNPDAPS